MTLPNTPDPRNGLAAEDCPALPPLRSNSLADLAARIRTEHEAAADAIKSGVVHAMAAGDLLIEAKAKVAHGQWLPWLAANCEIPERTVQAYMRLERLPLEKRNAVADLPLREALSAIRSREQRLADTAALESRRLGPAQFFATAPDGTALIGDAAVQYINTGALPPPPPPTDEEIADELIRQLEEVWNEWPRKVSVELLRSAFERRFGLAVTP